MHALHVVHAQSTSVEIAPCTRSASGGGGSASGPSASSTGARDSMYAFASWTSFRGESGLPLRHAGHWSWHRPQFVQASKSSSCLDVSCVISDAPNTSSVSRSPIGRSAPLGRVTEERITRLSGLTKMCMSGPNRQAA